MQPSPNFTKPQPENIAPTANATKSPNPKMQPTDLTPGMAVSAFDNSGHAPLLVPGFGMPLFVEASPPSGRRRFARALDSQPHWPMRATAREIAMLRCMEAVTDKRDWHRDVFSDAAVAAWKHEATRADWKISDKAWAWCVAELRDKAGRFGETGRAVVLDYGAGAVCKADLRGARDDDLVGLLKKAVDEVVEREPWKGLPRADGVAGVVDAHLAPLVYNQTRVLVDGGAVGRGDMDDWYGRGETSTRPTDDKFAGPTPAEAAREGRDVEQAAASRRFSALGTLLPAFQWLPCEVEWVGGQIRVTSYINDLHPHRQAPAYPAIERAIENAIESWNDVLVLIDPGMIRPDGPSTGRTPARIKTFGVQYPVGLGAWDEKFGDAKRAGDVEAMAVLTASLQSLEEEVSKGLVGSRQQVYYRHACDFNGWELTRRLVHPEPGVSFSYQDWRAHHNLTRAIVPPSDDRTPRVEECYSVSLQDEFRDAGLQVVVQIKSIELTPTSPRFVDETWHAADGLVTDYIAATSILFFDLDNIDPIRIGFQQYAVLHEYDLPDVQHDDFTRIMEVFDLDYSDWRRDLCQPSAFPRVQELGPVVAAEGRMLSFPGPVGYQFEPCNLVDPSKPGRARYLALYLVDPNYRVCSTRNVPPQRMDWWRYDVARKAPEALARLPRELFDQIVAGADAEGMLDVQEMERARDAMEEERRANEETIRDDVEYYRFCFDDDHILNPEAWDGSDDE